MSCLPRLDNCFNQKKVVHIRSFAQCAFRHGRPAAFQKYQQRSFGLNLKDRIVSHIRWTASTSIVVVGNSRDQPLCLGRVKVSWNMRVSL